MITGMVPATSMDTVIVTTMTTSTTNAIWEIEASRAVLPKDATVPACLAAPCNGKAYGCGCQVALSTGGLANNVPNFFPDLELALFPRQPRLSRSYLPQPGT
jgi:hypothetical protein